jgi:hypothetical protein
MKDNIEIAADYTEWMVKTGGFARDKTLRDHFAAEAMRPSMFSKPTHGSWDEVAKNAYEVADAMLKERAK